MPVPADDNAKASAQGVFATTHWSVVLAAGHQSSPASQDALERLCQTYWYPLYAFVRRRGYRPEDAQDLTQSFFARVLERDLLRRASPERGRFRSFLLTSLQNFLADEYDRSTARKRGSGQPLISWDALDPEARYALEPAGESSPDRLFERRWATTVLELAWKRLENEYHAAGNRLLFDRLRQFNSVEQSPQGYKHVANELGMPENTVKSHVHRLRRRYRELLREEISQTVASPAELPDEIRYLLAVLGQET